LHQSIKQAWPLIRAAQKNIASCLAQAKKAFGTIWALAQIVGLNNGGGLGL